MYIKDFDGWNLEKQKLEKTAMKIFFPTQRQIRYTRLGVNIGFEADGKGEYIRPVLIIKKIGSLFWCIPMTTKHKENIFHYKLTTASFGNHIISSLMLSQARIIDKKRFEEMLGYISQKEFQTIKKLLKDMYLSEAS